MKQRVRAVLVTPRRTMLVIKRIRPGTPAYWVLPGGGVEESDASLESALRREVWEEVAGRVEITGLFHTLEYDGQRQYFYLARIEEWDFGARSGPEFARDDRGEYLLEEIPLTSRALRTIDLMPREVADLIRESLADGRSPGGQRS